MTDSDSSRTQKCDDDVFLQHGSFSDAKATASSPYTTVVAHSYVPHLLRVPQHSCAHSSTISHHSVVSIPERSPPQEKVQGELQDVDLSRLSFHTQICDYGDYGV